MLKQLSAEFVEFTGLERRILFPRGVLPEAVRTSEVETLAFRLLDISHRTRREASEQPDALRMEIRAQRAIEQRDVALRALTAASPYLQTEIDVYQNFGNEFFVPAPESV